MARTKFGGGSADYFVDPATGLPVPSFTVQAYDSEIGGTHLTDLLDASGTPAVAVTSDSFGGFRFQGPDGYQGGIWLAGAGGTRYLTNPSDIAPRLAQAEADILAETTAVTGDRDMAIASGVSDAKTYTDDSFSDHTLPTGNPHIQYARLVDAAGNPTGGRLIVVGAGGMFPPVEVGSVLFYGGS
jgi:hypothetical protein